jgi:hypothetical protein
MQVLVSEIIGSQNLNHMKAMMPAAPDWFVYSLPGGLWLFSALASLLMCAQTIPTYLRTAIIIALTLVPIGMECLQYFHITDGTFDPMDIYFQLLAIVVSGFTLYVISKKNLVHINKAHWNWKWVFTFFIAILIFGDQWRF